MSVETVGQKIKRFRKRSGISQMELETAVSLSTGSLSRIENDQVNPTKETILKIIALLELSSSEAASLFNIEIDNKMEALFKASKAITSTLDLKKVLQYAVDELVKEMGLLSCFIVLKKGRKLYATTTTNTPVSRISLQLIPQAFDSLSVDLDKDLANLMVKTVLENKPFTSSTFRDFIIPAVSTRIASLIEQITKVSIAISLPIKYNDEVIGAILFGKSEGKDFTKELSVFEAFTEQVSVAITHAQEHERLKRVVEYRSKQPT